jgi:predicted LPLAT superfamily acyltransferase
LSADWLERPEGGSVLAMRLLASVALAFGRTLSRLVLFPITAYFLIRRGPERRASRAYLARVLGRKPTLLEIARHFHVFAGVTLDRVFLLTDRLDRFDIRMIGLEEAHAAMARGKGVLLVGAHAGSFDALRALSLKRTDATFKVVLDAEHSPALSSILKALNPQMSAGIINPRQDPTSVVLAIGQALQEGALVTMLGDRARPGNATVPATFLGSAAHFPAAPWQIAAALHVPVVLVIGLFRGGNRYDLHFAGLFDEIRIDRRQRDEQLRAVVQRFADRLEEHVRKAPYNWFNFYDFWNDSAPDAAAAHDREPAGRGG